jgi:hypothetical protein
LKEKTQPRENFIPPHPRLREEFWREVLGGAVFLAEDVRAEEKEEKNVSVLRAASSSRMPVTRPWYPSPNPEDRGSMPVARVPKPAAMLVRRPIRPSRVERARPFRTD